MADYLSLEDAAKKLGIPSDRLVELRSQGQVRGFRDGASWKFPENEIERLADDLADSLGGSGDLIDDFGADSSLSSSKSGSKIIGGDEPKDEGGSDIEVGGESLKGEGSGGSDVNLVASTGDEGSDVALVAGDSDLGFDTDEDNNLVEIDSAELQLDHPAINHDSEMIDMAIEPNAGSTGPVTDKELEALTGAKPIDVMAEESSVSLDNVLEGDATGSNSDLSFPGISEEDSDDVVIGQDDEDSIDALADEVAAGSKKMADPSSSSISSLELMDDLGAPVNVSGTVNDVSGDVLSELDLLSAEQGGSGLITGDSENLLASSGLGSSLGLGGLSSGVSGLGGGSDDALAISDDDDLLIADDDDLVINSAESDLSLAGDSGINLMSPSDSGLSLESEPLDLAGSSISALDLAAEVQEGSGSGLSGAGSGVDFTANEEFQLSPSGIGLEAEVESGSQVIEIEDSGVVAEAEPVFEAGGFDEDPEAVPAGEAFADGDEGGVGAIGIDASGSRESMASVGVAGFEVPFTLLQCVTLVMIIAIMSLGGMLMTDLLRNMWTYNEASAPVSSLTDSLISLIGLDS
ncbi:Helix-turn-helix domain protein [Planctomycetes bacterium CA13]|uniref:Helix-turn-helix domain protein n=1 Tax=Novipirellula herctigrandis TaxID=2527986 RepID=A0A5C5YPX8_9BACT|nr:Helix-turn-helix domain protein [Planctomycetes bacterium CA13]